MDPTKDAYGQEVMAYYLRKENYEIVERDDGFIGISEIWPYFAEFREWKAKIEKEAIKLAKGRVLDIGAGPGRVSLYLQKKGFEVTAIDNSPLAVKVCKKRGVKNAKVLPIEGMGNFKAGSFDTVVMFGNNFGLFGSARKAKRLLRKLNKITNQSAIILAESSDVVKTHDPAHRAYQRLNLKRGRLAGQLRLRVRHRQYVGPWFDYLMVSKKQMKDILKGTGWKVRSFFSDDPGYIAVIEKEN